MLYTTCPSPVGQLTLAGDEDGLYGLWIEGQKYFGGAIRDKLTEQGTCPVLEETKDWLRRYFAGERPDACALPIRPVGSAFQQQVWQILREIPYGRVVTYGEIAKEIARRMGRETMSGQAVGGAVGHNPISIIIPCHRVVGAGGRLTGYAAGLHVKAKLLELEGVELPPEIIHAIII